MTRYGSAARRAERCRAAPSPIQNKTNLFVYFVLFRGCVEKWLVQIEEGMKSAVRDIIDGALETVVNAVRSEWVQEWPCQAVLVAAFLDATAASQEAIKGGTGALKDLQAKYVVHNEELTSAIRESNDASLQEVLASMMIHDMYTQVSFVFVMMGNGAGRLCSAQCRAAPCRAMTHSKQNSKF